MQTSRGARRRPASRPAWPTPSPRGASPRRASPSSALIAAVWVNPAADDEQAVFENNREATLTALRNARDGAPPVADVLAARDEPWNPFFRPVSQGGRR